MQRPGTERMASGIAQIPRVRRRNRGFAAIAVVGED
jgi:hypothetical protein